MSFAHRERHRSECTGRHNTLGPYHLKIETSPRMPCRQIVRASRRSEFPMNHEQRIAPLALSTQRWIVPVVCSSGLFLFCWAVRLAVRTILFRVFLLRLLSSNLSGRFENVSVPLGSSTILFSMCPSEKKSRSLKGSRVRFADPFRK